MAAVERLIGGAFAEALEAGRPHFNALFAQARRSMPSLDPGAFAGHLRNTVAPIVEQVARARPDRVAEVVDQLYEFSLELVGKELPGRYPALTEGWQALLGGLPEHLAGAPRLFAGSITNALYNLSIVPEARPREWIAAMLRLGRLCAETGPLLEAGQVAAWRAGLAHFREGALEICRRLEPSLARAALGIPDTGSEPPLATILQRLQADPWLDPAAVSEGPEKQRRLWIVARVGAFRGFGGLFLCPPRVALSGGRFFVADSEACWLLTADRFGATLHRAGIALPAGPPCRSPRFQVDRSGRVTAGGQTMLFSELKECTSFASDATTLAVTVPLSHAVYLLALAE